MKMYVGGQWVDGEGAIDVINPFDGSVVDTVPKASDEDIENALASAARGAKVMSELTGYERYEILKRTADLMQERIEDFGRTITMEEGKVIGEGRGEAARAMETITLSAATIILNSAATIILNN